MKLSEELQVVIVQRLACYDTPQQIADAVKEEFGVVVDRRQVETYNAERPGKKPAEKWCALFHDTRKRFLDAIDQVPIAHTAVRLRRLDQMAKKAQEVRNYALAGQLLEQAAKERGGLYTNRRELTGKDGGPIKTQDLGPNLDELSDTQLAARAAKLAAEVG